MIWKSIHITAKALEANEFLHKQLTQSSTTVVTDNTCTFTIAIVGGGPKGLYALDEILAAIKNHKIAQQWQIFWFNETPDFGSGPNYQVAQPDYLLINYCIGHIDAWNRSTNQSAEALDLRSWITKYKSVDQAVQPTDFASRAVVGLYLQYIAMQVIRFKPNNVVVQLVAEKVKNIQSSINKKLQLETATKTLFLDNVLLTTGHAYQNLPLLSEVENSNPNRYFTSAYPLTILNNIPAMKKVAVIGWGLTFIDVALHFTEGRGGSFNASYQYKASGKEPIILPFSRNHLPIIPRSPIYGAHTYTLYYLTEEWFAELLSVQKLRKIDFTTEILPWLEKEWQFAYYSTLLQTRDIITVEEYVKSIPESERFTSKDLLFAPMVTSGALQDSYINYITYLIAEAEKGEKNSPLMAAAAVWREASPFISKCYQAGGFTGASQQYFDQNLFGALCRTSYGPPIENMKKIKSLLQAGIIQVHFTHTVSANYNKHALQFELSDKKNVVLADYIVDARVARPNLFAQNADLYHKLYQNNLVQAYTNEGYEPGCVKMDLKGKIQNPAHNLALYAYGSNTEGFLLDNDSLSRKKNNLGAQWATETIKQYLLDSKL